MKNRAFTLIELLVVVLIIGILAAIAVPKYQKAVIKSKYSTLKPYANALFNAVNVYHLANGQWPQNLLDLDLSFSGKIRNNNKHVYIPNSSNPQMQCYIWYDGNGNSGLVACERDGLTYLLNFQDKTNRLCRITGNSNVEILKQVCFDETQDTAPTRNGLDYKYKN